MRLGREDKQKNHLPDERETEREEEREVKTSLSSLEEREEGTLSTNDAPRYFFTASLKRKRKGFLVGKVTWKCFLC